MPADPMPAAEVEVDAPLARALLAEQFPDLADLELRLVANGWDNAIFRLGPDLALRLPRRAAAAALVEHEHRWLPTLAPHLPLPIPAPVHRGHPSGDYPWAWSVCDWHAGRVALETPPADEGAAADTLGRFVAALHRPAPDDAPRNPFRGIPLAEREQLFHAGLDRLHDDAAVDRRVALDLWRDLVATPRWSGPPVWLHGDLHPGNVVVHDGAIAAVIDFGDLTSGDPATDLMLAWMLFDTDDARRAFRRTAGDVDDDTWRRAEGWALAFAIVLLSSSADNPTYTQLGRRTLAAVLDRS